MNRVCRCSKVCKSLEDKKRVYSCNRYQKLYNRYVSCCQIRCRMSLVCFFVNTLSANLYFCLKSIYFVLCNNEEHIAQLSPRDRAAGRVSFGQKWKTGTGTQYCADHIKSIFNHCDVIGQQSYRIR